MGVKLREKSLKNGGVSFYLDISHNGKRWYQFLDIRTETDSRSSDEFKAKHKLAKKARSAKEYQLSVEKAGLPDETKQDKDIYAFIRQESSNLKRSDAYGYLCKVLEDYCNKPVLPMQELTKEFLLGFQTYLKKEEYEQSTTYMLVHRVSTYINKAIELGYMTTNPFLQIPRSLRVRMKKPIPKFLTLAQLQSLAANAQKVPDQLRIAFLLSAFAGPRWSDVSRLQWSQISEMVIDNKTETVMRLKQVKTGVEYLVPLSGQAKAIIDERKQKAAQAKPSRYVFPELEEPEGATKVQLEIQPVIKRWGAQAGIPELHFHMARHTFATLTLAAGADIYTVSKLMGHTEIKSTMIYAQVVDRLKSEAVARLPRSEERRVGKECRSRWSPY